MFPHFFSESRGLLHNHQLAERRELFVWKSVESSDGIEAAPNSFEISSVKLQALIENYLKNDLAPTKILDYLPAGYWVEAETLSLLDKALRWYKSASKQASVSARLQSGEDVKWKEINQYLKEALGCCANHKDIGEDLLLALQIHQHLRIIRNFEAADIPFILQSKQHLVALLQDQKFDLDFHAQTNPQLAKFIADLHAAGFDFPKHTEETRKQVISALAVNPNASQSGEELSA